jgi:hypothetical protein
VCACHKCLAGLGNKCPVCRTAIDSFCRFEVGSIAFAFVNQSLLAFVIKHSLTLYSFVPCLTLPYQDYKKDKEKRRKAKAAAKAAAAAAAAAAEAAIGGGGGGGGGSGEMAGATATAGGGGGGVAREIALGFGLENAVDQRRRSFADLSSSAAPAPQPPRTLA